VLKAGLAAPSGRIGQKKLIMRASNLFVRVALCAVFTLPAAAQQGTAPAGAATLFQDVRIFDGKSAQLSAPSFVLEGNTLQVQPCAEFARYLR
jgi:hypothetical protein